MHLSILTLLISIFLCGCGRIQRPKTPSTPPQTQSSELKDIGSFFTKAKRFLVKPSATRIRLDPDKPEETTTINYHIVTSNLEPLNSDSEIVEVHFGMREYKGQEHFMGPYPAKIERIAPTIFKVSLDFSMDDKWYIQIKIRSKRDGTIIDEMEHEVFVE